MAKLRLLKTGHGDLCLAECDVNDAETVAGAKAASTENFTAGRYVGVPLLQWFGMTVEPRFAAERKKITVRRRRDF